MEIGFEKSEADFQKCYESSHAQLLKEHKLYDIYNSYEGINNLKTVNDNAGIEDPTKAELPDPAALEEAAKHTSIEDVIIDETAGTIYLKDPEMSLDVGGIGKGYATENAAKLIQNEGSENFLLNLGGNVRAIGIKGDGSKWVCPVESPEYRDSQTGDQYAITCYLDGRSLVTSGDYERYYVVDGQRYHHIIDKDTLAPATRFSSVSVMVSDSGVGDALSTALFCMPYEAGRALAERFGAEVLWITPEGEILRTEGMK